MQERNVLLLELVVALGLLTCPVVVHNTRETWWKIAGSPRGTRPRACSGHLDKAQSGPD